jgi:hypothetical protein
MENSQNSENGNITEESSDKPPQTSPPSLTPPNQTVTPEQSNFQDTFPAEKYPRRSKKFIFSIVFAAILSVFLISSAAVYAVAYEKINIGNNKIQNKVAYAVQSLPFTPKTPKYILIRSMQAHKDISKQKFDISMAIDSTSFADPFGFTKFDFEVKGGTDISNPDDVKIDITMNISKLFSMELKKNDPVLYFKLTKLPTLILAAIGFTENDFEPILNKWVAYDTTPLSTQARKQMTDKKKSEPFDFYQEKTLKFLDDKEILKKLKLSSVVEDATSLYKIEIVADDELLDYLSVKISNELSGKPIPTPTLVPNIKTVPTKTTKEPEKLSQIIKNVKYEIYFDKKDYYTRKVLISFDIQPESSLINELSPALSTGSDKGSVVILAKFYAFGEELNIETPQMDMSFEQFVDTFTRISKESYYSSDYLLPQKQISNANDSQRKSDLIQIKNALEMYKIECNSYPFSLLLLTQPSAACPGSYLRQVPTDPETKESYYYRSNTIDYNLCAKLNTPEANKETCPDSNFNYHISNQ